MGPILNMDTDKEKKDAVEQYEDVQRIRMTLKGREVKPLEWACNEILVRAKNKGYETRGPVRIPTKILRVTTRKSPCGEGTNTWDRDEIPQESHRYPLPILHRQGHHHVQDRRLR